MMPWKSVLSRRFSATISTRSPTGSSPAITEEPVRQVSHATPSRQAPRPTSRAASGRLALHHARDELALSLVPGERGYEGCQHIACEIGVLPIAGHLGDRGF